MCDPYVNARGTRATLRFETGAQPRIILGRSPQIGELNRNPSTRTIIHAPLRFETGTITPHNIGTKPANWGIEPEPVYVHYRMRATAKTSAWTHVQWGRNPYIARGPEQPGNPSASTLKHDATAIKTST